MKEISKDHYLLELNDLMIYLQKRVPNQFGQTSLNRKLLFIMYNFYRYMIETTLTINKSRWGGMWSDGVNRQGKNKQTIISPGLCSRKQ